MTQIRFPLSVRFAGRETIEGFWEYSTSDPWAIVLHLDGQRWMFARELLRAGLAEPAGYGDVQIMPDTGGNPTLLLVRLSSPAGTASLPVARDTVRSLVEVSYALVPDGGEAACIDWDREWARLADGGSAAA